jgi:hypothetical protein
MRRLIHIDELCSWCGHLEDTEANTYGCSHPDCGETRVIDNKTGKEIDDYVDKKDCKLRDLTEYGKCFTWSCPFGIRAEEEDFKEFGEDSNLMTVGEWLVVDDGKHSTIKDCCMSNK